MSHPSEMEFDLALVDAPSATFSSHLVECARCRERLDRLRAEQEQFRASEEPRRAAWAVAARIKRSRRWMWIPAATAAAAALLLVLRPPSEIRTKGGPGLSVFVKRASTAPVRWDGTPLDEGDAVQLEIDPAGRSYATVFSVDARCQVALEHEHTGGAGLIAASWTVRGPGGGERLYVAFSSRPVAAHELAATLRAHDACDPLRAPDFDTPELSARGVVLRARR